MPGADHYDCCGGIVAVISCGAESSVALVGTSDCGADGLSFDFKAKSYYRLAAAPPDGAAALLLAVAAATAAKGLKSLSS